MTLARAPQTAGSPLASAARCAQWAPARGLASQVLRGGIRAEVLLGEVGAVEGDDFRLPLEDGLDVHGAVPEKLEVVESLASVVQPQVHPFVPVRQVQLAAVVVVGVCDVDEGLAEVCQLEQQSPLHLREFPALD